jgi:hypothetical protein
MLSPLYGQLSPLRVPTKAVRQVQDSDALAYIAAVETADGQSLEAAVQYAYEDFILGCKGDGIWSAIKASCILAGARTLSGALVPLIGSAPTNFNFVTGDYNREIGLIGDKSTKYLNTHRAGNADPQDNFHLSVYSSIKPTGGYLIGEGGTSGSISQLISNFGVMLRSPSVWMAVNVGNFPSGFMGGSRSASNSSTFRYSGATYSASQASSSPINGGPIFVFARSYNNSRNLPTDARLSFYSIGEALDLAALNTRVSTLMTDLAAAI